MKKFTLKIFGTNQITEDVVEAETHTIENGMIIFWIKNPEDVWAQVAVYPGSCTAITRFEEINLAKEIPQQMAGMPINITADVQQVINEFKAEATKGKRNTKK